MIYLKKSLSLEVNALLHLSDPNSAACGDETKNCVFDDPFEVKLRR